MTPSRLHNRHGNYTLVPNGFVCAPVTHEAFRLYIVLLMHAPGNAAEGGTVFPDYERLKTITGIRHNKTIANALRALEDAGWIERRRRFGASTVYTLTSPSRRDVMEDLPVRHGVTSITSPDDVHYVTPSKTNKTKVTRPNKQDNGASAPPPRNPLFDAIAELTKSSPALQGGMIAKIANQLKAIGATPEQVARFGQWWRVCDFRGIKGELPLLTQITPVWQRAIEWDGRPPKLQTAAPRSNGRTYRLPMKEYTEADRRAAEERAARALAEDAE